MKSSLVHCAKRRVILVSMPGKVPLIAHFVIATEHLLIGLCKLNSVVAKREVFPHLKILE